MFLKSLELFGFKSFAKKTSFEFSPGITAIVGPNGSGKSNIADAILWVFGEKSARILRGEKMEDVIFSGTKEKTPLNMAEVSLTFDNSTGFLDSEYNELTITRRLYRSGESSYMINKTPCRRMDIMDKFMDTGIGKDAYSIISQGQINEILLARPVQRRYLIEEAAGISKYKNRKEEALKRLENCKNDLIRVNDILEELKIRIVPLKKEAKRAKKYKKLNERLKQLDAGFFALKIEKENNRLVEIKEKVEKLQTNFEEVSKEKNNLEIKEEKLKHELLNLEKELESKNEKKTGIIEELEGKQGEKKIYQERIKGMEDNKEKLKGELTDLDEKIAYKKEDEEELEKESSGLKRDLAAEEEKYYKKEKEMSLLRSDVTSKEDLEEDLNEIIKEKTTLKAKIENLESKIEEINETLKVNADKKEEKDREIEKTKENTREIENKKNKLVEELDKIQKELEKTYTYNNKLENKEKNISQGITERKDRLQKISSRLETLREFNSGSNNLPRGVREVLERKQKGEARFNGVLGTVSDLIKIPSLYEIAIETSLGRAIHNLVVNSSNDAINVINFLKASKKGRVTCLPLDDLKPGKVSQDIKEKANNTRGYCGIASDLLHLEDEYRVVAKYLLGRVIVMEGIDNALEFAKKINFAVRIVTLEGELILPGGAMVGGSRGSEFSGAKNKEIKALKGEIEKLEKALEEKKENLKRLEQEKRENKEKLEALREDKHSLEMNLKEKEKELEGARKELDRLEQEAVDISSSREKYKRNKNDLLKSLEKENGKLEEVNNQERDLKEKQKKIKEEESTIAKDKSKLEEELNDCRVQMARLKEKLESSKEKKRTIENNLHDLMEKKEKCEKELEENTKKLAIFYESIEKLKRKVSHLEKEQVELVEEVEKLKENRDGLKDKIAGLENERKRQQKKERELEKKLDELKFKQKEVENSIKIMLDDLFEKYQLSFEQALEFKPLLSEKEDEEVENTIDKLKKQINSIQPVNINAIDEYNNLKTRLDFLQKQRNDLLEAEKSLKEIIEEIDDVMKKRFKKTLQDVDKEFKEVFKNLFEGGEASLNLTLPGDILNTGLEIKARPPGKKLKNISLLSGGEKALTVIALLLSLLKIKPTPFCILDEIDASLDDNNLSSYSNYLKEFSQKTQFIVITHRKEMMQNCDSLYGLTMPLAGVSELVSIDLGKNTDESA